VAATASSRDRAIDVALWLGAVACAGATVAYSLLVTPPAEAAATFGDKALHAAAYLATGLCLLLAAVWRPGRGQGPFPSSGPRIWAGIVVAGTAIELVQGLIPLRRAEALDIVADLVGASAALAVVALLRRAAAVEPIRLRRRSRRP
jgi:VanZ family protein